MLLVAVVAEFGVVLGISVHFNRISSGTATVLFFVFAAVNGFTLSIILLVLYPVSFFGLCINGPVVRNYVSNRIYYQRGFIQEMGTYLIMGVIGLVIAIVVNMFVNSAR